MSQPKISVIVPVYNVELYLRDCLDSIINQTYKNLEIILIDDGSTDGSGAICDEHKWRDDRILVLHKRNGGLSAARNAGLDISSGDYISFVDSDDSISPIFLESLLLSGAEITQCDCTRDVESLAFNSNPIFEYMSGFEMSEKLCQEGALNNTVVWSKLWKREVLENIRFPEGHIHEDEFTTWKALWKAKTVARTTSQLYFYRRRCDSIINSRDIRACFDFADALRERMAFYKEHDAVKLEHLTKALFCHVLREHMGEISKCLPNQAKSIKRELRHAYRELLSSKEITLRKKATVTLQMANPHLYSTVKALYQNQF